MQLTELNIRTKMVIESVEGILKDCESSDELEVVASCLGLLLASMTALSGDVTKEEQLATIFKVGQEAKKRIAAKEKEND